MAAQHFFIGEALGVGWKKTKEHLGYLIVLMVVAVLLTLAPDILGGFLADNVHEIFGPIMAIIGFIVQFFIGMVMILVSLKILDGEQMTADDIKALLPKALAFFVSGLLYSLIVFFGFILLVVPGVIWSIKYRYFAYFIVERGAGPIEALKLSSEATRGVKWDLLGFGFATGMVVVLGLLALVVGLVVAMPTVMIAQAYVYRMLAGRSGGFGGNEGEL